jgi:two-component system phosphate regulon sensor histidine kinase PhoR
MFDIALSNAKGRFFLEVVQNSDIAGLVAEVQKREVVLSRELNLFLPFQRILRVNASPISESGKPGGCLLVIHDVTKMRELETMRRDFVANVSHELKTPLTSIKGFVETLLEGALEDKDNSRKFLKIIQDHTDRLNNLINDLLDLSSIESEKITLKKEDFDKRIQLASEKEEIADH